MSGLFPLLAAGNADDSLETVALYVAAYAAVVATLALVVSAYLGYRQFRQRLTFAYERGCMHGECLLFPVRLANRSQHDVRVVHAFIESKAHEGGARLKPGAIRKAERGKKLGTEGVDVGVEEKFTVTVGARDGKRFRVWIRADVLAGTTRARVVLETGTYDMLRSKWIKVSKMKECGGEDPWSAPGPHAGGRLARLLGRLTADR